MSATRDDFVQTWLEEGEPNPAYTSFQHLPMRERPDAQDEIIGPLTQAVVDHHSHLNRINNWIQALGFEATRLELDKQLAMDHNTKMGNFGEVVASEALVQERGYKMPVFKLRYRDSKLPMRGEDMIAFRFDGNGDIDLVIVGEAKVRATYNSAAVTEAYGRLQACYKPHPQTLNLIAEVLYGVGKDTEGQAIDALIAKLAAGQVNQEHWVILLTGNEHEDPFGCITASANDPPLICVDLPIKDLSKLVESVFQPSVHWENPNAA